MSEETRLRRQHRRQPARYTNYRGVRFSDEAAAQLARLAEKLDRSEAWVIRWAVSEAARREGLE